MLQALIISLFSLGVILSSPFLDNSTDIELVANRSQRVPRESFIYEIAPYDENYRGEKAIGQSRQLNLPPAVEIPECPKTPCTLDGFVASYTDVFIFSFLLILIGVVLCLIVFFCFSFR